MTFNPNGTPVTVPGISPRVTLANGNIAAILFARMPGPTGPVNCFVVAEALASDPSTFRASLTDSNVLTNADNPGGALADLLIAAGYDPAFMPPDPATYAMHWLTTQTYASAITAIKAALVAVFQKLVAKLILAYPGSAPPPPPVGVPTDLDDLLNYWLGTYVTLHAATNGAVTATSSGP